MGKKKTATKKPAKKTSPNSFFIYSTDEDKLVCWPEGTPIESLTESEAIGYLKENKLNGYYAVLAVVREVEVKTTVEDI